MKSPYGPMDKAPAYGAGDSGFESQYGLLFLGFFFFHLKKKASKHSPLRIKLDKDSIDDLVHRQRESKRN